MCGIIPLQPTRGCPLVRRKRMKGESGDESESRGMNLCGRIRSQNQWRTSGHLHLQASGKPTCNPSLMPGTNDKAPWHHSISHYKHILQLAGTEQTRRHPPTKSHSNQVLMQAPLHTCKNTLFLRNQGQGTWIYIDSCCWHHSIIP